MGATTWHTTRQAVATLPDKEIIDSLKPVFDAFLRGAVVFEAPMVLHALGGKVPQIGLEAPNLATEILDRRRLAKQRPTKCSTGIELLVRRRLAFR